MDMIDMQLSRGTTRRLCAVPRLTLLVVMTLITSLTLAIVDGRTNSNENREREDELRTTWQEPRGGTATPNMAAELWWSRRCSNDLWEEHLILELLIFEKLILEHLIFEGGSPRDHALRGGGPAPTPGADLGRDAIDDTLSP